MTESEAALVKEHVRVYVVVFVALAGLTVVTVAISYLQLSTALAVGLGVWATRDFAQSGSWVHLSLGVGSFVGSVVLAWYGVWFLRKLKHTSFL